MADQNCVAALGIEFAIGFKGQLVMVQDAAALQLQRLFKQQRLRCGY